MTTGNSTGPLGAIFGGLWRQVRAYLTWATSLSSMWAKSFALLGPILVGVFALSAFSSALGSDDPPGDGPAQPVLVVVTATAVPSSATAAPTMAPAVAQPTTTAMPPAPTATQPPPTATQPLPPPATAMPALLPATPTTPPPPTSVPPTSSPVPPLPTATRVPPTATRPPQSSGYASGDAYNCADFSTYAQAKAYFDAVPGDPSRLDADNDGIPCESLPGAP